MRPLDIALCIHVMYPPGLYSGTVVRNTKEEFDRMVWEDTENPKPTWQELNTFWQNNQNLFDQYYEN